MNEKVVSGCSSIKGAHMSKMYGGTKSSMLGLPWPRANAQRSSVFLSGRFAKAIHPRIDFMRFIDRASNRATILDRI